MPKAEETLTEWAVRVNRNAALEEAARVCEERGCPGAAAAIRALKADCAAPRAKTADDIQWDKELARSLRLSEEYDER